MVCRVEFSPGTIDPATGQQVLVKPQHSLFFIPVVALGGFARQTTEKEIAAKNVTPPDLLQDKRLLSSKRVRPRYIVSITLPKLCDW